MYNFNIILTPSVQCTLALHSTSCIVRYYELYRQTLRVVLSDTTSCIVRYYELYCQTLRVVLSDTTICIVRHSMSCIVRHY